ncbi:MAG TPA: HAD family phosphatase [bacterium]|nr:HAD family phosphatase [bacterium]
MDMKAARNDIGIEPRKVRAVVFDLGGVFLEGGPSNVRAFGARIGLAPEAWDAIRHELFVEGDAWDRVERGESTLDQFAQVLQARVRAAGTEIGLREARDFMGSPGDRAAMPVRPAVVAACRALRERMPTALLTNNIAEWRESWRRRMDVDSLFDVVVDSSEAGVRKPDEGIYRLVEQGLGLSGEALLFVDDLGVNLKTARRLGWQTLKYVDTAEVVAVLDEVVAAHPSRG